MLLYRYKYIVECRVHIGTWHFTLNYIELHLFCSTIDRGINIKLLTLNAIHDTIFIELFFLVMLNCYL